MEILIVAIVISAISIYGAVMLKRLYFLLGYFLFSILALTSLIPTYNDDKMLALTSIALFLVMGIISFPAKKNISDYKMNEEAKPLVKSFMLKTLLSLSAVNLIAIFLVKFDPNMPEGITESMRIYPMIMHAVLGILPLFVLFRMSQSAKLK
ncbi:hypothetical protein OAA11_00770 [Schleiferiaceae bacterium]|jgi:hypothetical protein|nr:hypothetical protein [Schleiferiaceae bacterium]MDA9052331.1 hypothetical protein [Schleiferiaceae bacterium]MDA9237254.1 hypothetical protein [Schleiferiaceae bacterium]MDB2436231.1 hypothetical protein [Schleiferiaceae bacterium]MDB4343703.1 hypothetical protein [Schleiferiaceae bacterium]